jgi:hypothetical protein
MLREEKTPPSFSLPDNIKTKLPSNIARFQKPSRVRLDPGCIDVLGQNVQQQDDATARIIPALQRFIEGQPEENDTSVIRNPRFVAAVDAVVRFRLPVHIDSAVSESFFSHQLWAAMLTSAVGETSLECYWEVVCREGGENGKGKMIADFGAYTVIDDEPYYTILAELERGKSDKVAHKDFVVLVAEMRLWLEKAIIRVAVDDIGDLCVYGLLLSQTSARLLVMRAVYDRRLDEMIFILDDDAAMFDFDPSRSPYQLIEDIVDFFSFVSMAASPDGTGISHERFNRPGQRIDCKYTFNSGVIRPAFSSTFPSLTFHLSQIYPGTTRRIGDGSPGFKVHTTTTASRIV